MYLRFLLIQKCGKMDKDLKTLREELSELLKDNVLSVVFKKSDGTIREMPCTLNGRCIAHFSPPKPVNVDGEKPAAPKKINEDILKIFDVGVKEWRSFRIDSVIEHQILRKLDLETDLTELVFTKPV